MKLRRLIALLLAMIMVMSLVAGCDAQPQETQGEENPPAQTQGQEEPAVETTEGSSEIVFPLEETMNFTGMSVMANSYYYADNIGWNYALDRANIHIELTEFMKDECEEKSNMLLSSGEYPDMVYKPRGVDVDAYGMEGVFIPLEDLIREYAPNLSALLDERMAWDELKAPDGHIYSLPNVNISDVPIGTSGPIWINKRWMDNLGLKMPTNMEELYGVLKAFKEQDANGNGDPNDEIPFSYAGGTSKIMEGCSLLMEDVSLYSTYFANTGDGLVYYPATEAFKDDFLSYFAQMYADGIMDPNSLTQTSDQFNAVGISGDVIGMFQRSSISLVPEEYQKDYVVFQSYNNGGYPFDSGVGMGGMAITDKCQNPEVLVAWADWFYTEEGGRVVRMGIEGESYVINPDGSYTQLPAGDDQKYKSITYQTTLMGLATVPGRIPEYYYTGVNSDENPTGAHCNDQLINYMEGTIQPVLILTEEENENVSTIQADIQPYVENYAAQVIAGLISLDDTWADFQKTLKDMGVDQLIEAYQAAYARATAN